MFITYIHRTKESRNTKNTYDFLVQVRNFLLPLSLKVLRHKRKEAQSFYVGSSICPPPNTCGTHHKATARVTLLFQIARLNSLTFQNPPNPPRTLPVHDIIHIPWSWDFYFDICERHILPARTLTPALKFAPN